MNQLLINFLLIPIWFSAFLAPNQQESTPQPVVHAVMFYSPYCGHCELVITEKLPPLFNKYGDQLVIIGVDTAQPDGQALFTATLEKFNPPEQLRGVPFLVVGDTYLVGSLDIPEKFPGLIEQYLTQGGVDWPAIPGLAEAMAAPQPTATPGTPSIQSELLPTTDAPVQTPATGLAMGSDYSNDIAAKFSRDPSGNTLAVLVLGSMILFVGGAVIYLQRAPAKHSSGKSLSNSREWVFLILCLIGLAVAGYMAYVETAEVEAICGPVGDCNTVQQSEYARLFGILPIGVLGVIGYAMILLAWIIRQSTNQYVAAYANLALLGLTAFGVLFSIYLTFLEPFVIGATCAWCLTSAIIMTALFGLSLAPAKSAFVSIRHKS